MKTTSAVGEERIICGEPSATTRYGAAQVVTDCTEITAPTGSTRETGTGTESSEVEIVTALGSTS